MLEKKEMSFFMVYRMFFQSLKKMSLA